MGRLTYDREYAGHFFFFLAIVFVADGRTKKLPKLKCRLQYAASFVSRLGLQKQCSVSYTHLTLPTKA